jgi:hypothetical protein
MRIAASYLLLPVGGVLLLSDDVAAGFSFALLPGLLLVVETFYFPWIKNERPRAPVSQ